jgi:uncharacterized protein
MKTNPFVYEVFATGPHFCGRDEEIKLIKQLCSDGKNVLLYSKRRFGKSSLVKELFESHLPERKFLTIYVDLFEIIEANDFAKLFYKACAESMRFSVKQASQNLIKYFKKVHFGISVDESGMPSFAPTLASRDFDELIDDTFKGLSQYSKEKGVTIVVCFDEFQQITEISEKKLDAIIRKHIQAHNEISYVFSGSKQHILTELFNGPRKPLFSMATGIELKPISPEVFLEFANTHLNNRLAPETFEFLYDLVAGESKLLQQICYYLFYKEGSIDEIVILDTVEQVIRQSDGEYRWIFDTLPKPQKTALKSIVQFHGINLFYKSNLEQFGTTKQSLLSALNGLIKKDIVFKEHDSYLIADRKFHLWIKSTLLHT